MRVLRKWVGASLLLAGAAVNAAPGESGEARLARELAGRSGGQPVQCIDTHSVRSVRIIDRTAIIYEAGSTWYVNRPEAGLNSLDSWDTIVTSNFEPRLCSVDVVRLYDTASGFETGAVFLGDFVPYRKVAARRARP